jgi:hypothetical protein
MAEELENVMEEIKKEIDSIGTEIPEPEEVKIPKEVKATKATKTKSEDMVPEEEETEVKKEIRTAKRRGKRKKLREEEEEEEDEEEELEEEEEAKKETILEPEEEEELEAISTEDELVDKALVFVASQLRESGAKESTIRRLTRVLKMDTTRQWMISPTHFIWIVKQYLPRLPDIELGSIANVLYTKYGIELIRMRQQMSLIFFNYPQAQQYPNTFSFGTQVPPMTPPYNTPFMPTPTTQTSYPPQFMSMFTQTYNNPRIDEDNREKKKKVYTIVIDGQTIITDDYKEYLALKEWLGEQEKKKTELEQMKQKHEIEMMKLKEEIKSIAESHKKEESENVNPPPSYLQSLQNQIASLYNTINELNNKIEEEKKRREEERIKILEEKSKQLDDILNNPFTLIERWDSILSRMGYTRTGRTAYDLIDNLLTNIHVTTNALIQRMAPMQPLRQGVYTEKEREKRIKKAEELIDRGFSKAQLEKEIVETAREVYGPGKGEIQTSSSTVR